MTRRVIAAGAALVVLILVVLGVRSCQISARNSSLKDYTNNVSALNQQSVQTGQQFFNQLSSGNKSGNGTALQNQLNETRLQADNQLTKARGLDTPDEMKPAQTNFVLAMEMRRNGIAGVASQIQQALGTTTSKDAVNAIAAEMAQFYSSDVVYKNYTAPLISGALKSAGIAVGGANGISIDSHQFLPDITMAVADVRRHEARLPGGEYDADRQGHAGSAWPLAGFGQRRRNDAPDRIDEHDSRQPGADGDAQLHQRRYQQREERRVQGVAERNE